MASIGLACVLLLPGVARAEESVRIALVPLVVHSADDRVYLRDGLRDMLLARFAAERRVEIIRIEDVSKATSRLGEAMAIGREESADVVCFGSFTRFGSGASLDVQCASTHEEGEGPPLREIFVYSGNVGDVIPDLDELVGKIVRFAVSDYREGRAAQAAPIAAPAQDPIVALQQRVEALEAALARLEAEQPTDSAVPEEAEDALAAGRGEGPVR